MRSNESANSSHSRPESSVLVEYVNHSTLWALKSLNIEGSDAEFKFRSLSFEDKESKRLGSGGASGEQ